MHLFQQALIEAALIRVGEIADDRSGDDRTDLIEVLDAVTGCFVAFGGGNHGVVKSPFRPEGPRQQLRRRLTHMLDAERGDKAL